MCDGTSMEFSRPRRNESEEELLQPQDALGTRSSARLVKAGPRKGRDAVVLDGESFGIRFAFD